MCRRCEERRTKMHGRGRREGDTRTCLQDETGMSPAAGEKPSGERAAQSAALSKALSLVAGLLALHPILPSLTYHGCPCRLSRLR